MAIDSQVCFHRWLFANPVKPHQCITGQVEPLGCANQNWWGVRLLPISVLTHPVDCVHLYHLLRRQHHCLWPNGENPPSASTPTPHRLPPIHPLIHNTDDITGVVKNYLKKPAINIAQQSLL